MHITDVAKGHVSLYKVSVNIKELIDWRKVKLAKMFSKHKPQAGRRNWPWPSNSSERARDQTRLPCEFGANPLNGSRDIFIHKQKVKSHKRRQERNPTQFTSCNKCFWTVERKGVTTKRQNHNIFRITSLGEIWGQLVHAKFHYRRCGD